MKKLLLILMLLLPVFSFSQTETIQIITINNKVYTGKIASYFNKQLNFSDINPTLVNNSISINQVATIRGKIPEPLSTDILIDNSNIIISNST